MEAERIKTGKEKRKEEMSRRGSRSVAGGCDQAGRVEEGGKRGRGEPWRTG